MCLHFLSCSLFTSEKVAGGHADVLTEGSRLVKFRFVFGFCPSKQKLKLSQTWGWSAAGGPSAHEQGAARTQLYLFPG